MARLFRDPRSGIYFIDLLIDGKRSRRSLRTRDSREAERRLARFIGAGRTEEDLDFDRRHLTPCGDFLAEYLAYSHAHKTPSTWRTDRSVLTRFFDRIRRPHLQDVSVADLIHFQQERLETVKLTSVHREMQIVRAAFRWALTMEYLAENPTTKIPRLRVPKARMIEFLRDEAIAKLLAAAGQPVPCRGRGRKGRGRFRRRLTPLVPMIALAAYAGLRPGVPSSSCASTSRAGRPRRMSSHTSAV